MESSEKEMLVILIEFFEMQGVSVLENVVAVLVVVSVLICSIKTLASNRRATAIVSTSWITWFLYRMVLDYKVAIEEVTRLAMDTFVSTQICVHSFAIMVVSWMALIAPFACDSYLLGHKIYTSLTMIQRVAIVVVVFIVYGCFKTYTTVVSNADKVKQIMFHISFVLVAPIIWYTILYMPSEWTGSLSDLVLTWIPFGVSCNLFYKCAKIRSRSSSSSTTIRCCRGCCQNLLFCGLNTFMFYVCNLSFVFIRIDTHKLICTVYIVVRDPFIRGFMISNSTLRNCSTKYFR